MKAIILVAGYATRLYPLTLDRPKALLPIKGKAIAGYIIDEIDKIDAVDEIYMVSNHKFAQQFEDWAKDYKCSKAIKVIDDGTTTEETRRGAIGDILYTIDEMNIDDEIFVVAGDNFFTYSLEEYYKFYKEKDCDCVCVKPFFDEELLKSFGIALLEDDGKVIEIEEKPENPKSNMVVYAAYMYKKDTIPMFKEYIEEGNKPDAPGYFAQWLCSKKDVYAFKFNEECYDIGTPKSYKEVCELFGGE